jgi:hypothetical protein
MMLVKVKQKYDCSTCLAYHCKIQNLIHECLPILLAFSVMDTWPKHSFLLSFKLLIGDHMYNVFSW